jgi:hypothetical protein
VTRERETRPVATLEGYALLQRCALMVSTAIRAFVLVTA